MSVELMLKVFPRTRPGRRGPKLFYRFAGRRTPSFPTDSTRAANSEAFPRARPGRRDPKLIDGFDQGGELQIFPRI